MWPFDRNNAQMYQQYAQGYDSGDYSFFNPGQIVGQLAQFVQGAPPDLQQRVYQQHFSQMPYDQRAFLAGQAPQYGMDPNDPYSMSQGFMRMGQEQPGLLQRVLQHPMMLGGAMALTGLIAKHMISEHREHQREEYQQYDQQYGQPYGNPNQGGYPGQYDQYNQPPYGRGDERELRRELRREEREIERLEEREERDERRERRREDYY